DEGLGVGFLPMMEEAEHELVLRGLNATDARYPRDLLVHQLFAAQAARTPNAIAISWRGEQWTYAELERRTNQLAHALRRRGVGPEVRVGVSLPRTPEILVALLGVLTAGGAYVPLDPAYPRERLDGMVRDADVALVITVSGLLERLPDDCPATLVLDREADALAAESESAPESGTVPENLSHVIFTSGSTGRPKGVMIRHASTVVLLHWLRENVTDAERSAVLFSTSINFDVSVAEVFGTLCWGGKLVLVENALELASAPDEVVYASMVPSAAAELLRGGGIPASVRTLNLGGEALPGALARGLYALGTVERVGNLYGPTEDTTYSTYSVVGRGGGPVLVGRPVANTRAYVLDRHLGAVPISVAGELYLAGDGLARGYEHAPALTAERFVPDPFGAAGSRMYRVMDLARWRADGELEYLGRTDHQVKVRGYRIELGEIEARLLSHPDVREAVVLAREDAPGDRRLVAYYVGAEAVDAEALRTQLAATLPEYMVPAAYVRLDALPLTPNGKVDRKALPAPEAAAYGTRGYEAPAGPVETAVAEVWAEVLGVERVGRGDNFFELGGHSLLAVRLGSRLRQALGVEVTLGHLFTHPMLADFTRGLERGAPMLPPMAPAAAAERVALSFGQRGLWFLERMGRAGPAYHVPIQLRLRGELGVAALRRALDRIVARHEALRTTFAQVDGEPVQRFAAAESGFTLVEHDVRGRPDAELRRVLREEAGAPFDLEGGPPIRGRLIRTAADEHVLAVTMHHIVSDGWSMGVLTRELSALYSAFLGDEADPLPALPIQYADYAAWQRRWVDGEVLARQADYWTRTLTGAPELLAVPADHARPAVQEFAGGFAGVELDAELTAALKALGQRHGTTLFMTLLAGWALVLSRLSGQRDVVIGTPTANRGRPETEALIGFFVNTLALRVDLSGSPSVAELLGRVRTGALEAQQHQDIPFEQVVELVQPVRSPAHSPLYQVSFTWQNTPRVGLALPGLTVGPAGSPDRVTAKIDLSLSLGESNGRIVGGVEYATSLFEGATVERYLGYLRRALEQMAADESASIDRVPLLSPAERLRVTETWNGTEVAYPRESCIHELIEARARRTPRAVAVAWDGGALTYAELNEAANRLARHLRERGVGLDARVAICVERGPEMVVALLAVLKAGGGYVPLDPVYPEDRLRYMLRDSAPVLLLTRSALAGLFADSAIPVVDLDAGAAWADQPETNPARGGLTPRHLAYVIYTSGSTGRPKGVAVEHRGVCNLAAAQIRAFGVEPESRVLQFASFSFDACVSEVAMALCAGASLHLPPRGVVPAGEALVRMLEGEAITHVTLPPAVLATLPEDARLDSVRTLVLAGDVMTDALARRWAPGRLLLNAYGPTEATVCATVHECRADEDGNPPIGRPMENTRVYVLDDAAEPVPVGVAGELCIGGAGVARGYLGRPALTAERFV
ncbi:MAG TPA: amino acid adenylation domain-containing protein, partial [Longimicrobium sp.]|nr:amino acid adenylation domain-containing protein [Longimicrobium sp.]